MFGFAGYGGYGGCGGYGYARGGGGCGGYGYTGRSSYGFDGDGWMYGYEVTR